MVAGGALILIGTVMAGWGVVTALVASRPRNLAGAAAAAVGLALALFGAVRLAAPGFRWS